MAVRLPWVPCRHPSWPVRSPRTPRCGSAGRRTGWRRPRPTPGGRRGARRRRRGRAAAAARGRFQRRDRRRRGARHRPCWSAARGTRSSRCPTVRARHRRGRRGLGRRGRRDGRDGARRAGVPVRHPGQHGRHPGAERGRTAWRSPTCSSTSTCTTAHRRGPRARPGRRPRARLPRQHAQGPRRGGGAARPVPAAPGRHERPDPLPRAGPRPRRRAWCDGCRRPRPHGGARPASRQGDGPRRRRPRHLERRVVLHQPGAARRGRAGRAGPAALARRCGPGEAPGGVAHRTQWFPSRPARSGRPGGLVRQARARSEQPGRRHRVRPARAGQGGARRVRARFGVDLVPEPVLVGCAV